MTVGDLGDCHVVRSKPCNDNIDGRGVMPKEILKQVQDDELQQVERDGFAACSSSIPA